MLAPGEIAVSSAKTELAAGKAVDEIFRPKSLSEVLTELNIRPFTTKEIKQIKATAARAQQWQTVKRHKYGYLAVAMFLYVLMTGVALCGLGVGSLVGFSRFSEGVGECFTFPIVFTLVVTAWFVYAHTRVLWGTVDLGRWRDIVPRGVINRIDAIKTAMPEAEVLVHFCTIDPIIIVRHQQQQFCVAAWDMKEVLLPNVE